MISQDDNEKLFGIRVSLPEGDPFTVLLDENWNTTHWFDTKSARDIAMHDMQREHEYSRKGDKPALIFQAINRNQT